MAEYKGIHGTKIQNYTSDPANPITGQVWYNETSQTMKFQYPTTIAAWSTGGNLNTARRGAVGAGPQSGALYYGSAETPSNALTESYDGTTWTEVNDLTESRLVGTGFGQTQTAALITGGGDGVSYFGNTETWNGTSWTAVNDLNQAREKMGGFGSSTSGLVFGGQGPTAPMQSVTESWNGTSWTEVNDLNTARYQLAGSGTDNTAGLAIGGNLDPGIVGNNESWNGTSWTELNDLTTARYLLGAAGTANTASLAFGGDSPSVIGQTESWDGTSWTELNDMSVARYFNTGSGTQTSAIAAGGYNGGLGGNQSATEEWNAALPVGAWSTGGSVNTARYVLGGGGTKDNGIIFGGQPGGGTSVGNTELYNGSAWTEVNDLNTARERISPAANTQTAALGSGGTVYPGASDQALTESWNGTSWTEVNDLNTSGNGQFGFGDNTAAINAGGGTPPTQNKTEIWNGTSWTTSPATLNQGRKDAEGAGMGTSTAGLIAGGNNGSPAYAQTESWNGSAWTEVNDLNTARTGLVLSGTQTLGLAFGGQPPLTGATEEWNGTTWSTTPAMNVARRNFGGSAGTGTTSAFAATGIDSSFPPATTSTEEWTKPAFTVKTITSS